jgi:hypothetical protein
MLFSLRYLYFDITRTALRKLDTAGMQQFADDYRITLEVGQITNEIEFCLTGKVNYTSNGNTGSIDDSQQQATSTSEVDDINQKLVNFDPLTAVMTGGDSCRYCVASCPAN